jgi:hypothetical protein
MMICRGVTAALLSLLVESRWIITEFFVTEMVSRTGGRTPKESTTFCKTGRSRFQELL